MTSAPRPPPIFEQTPVAGFTLLETILTVAIVGILTAVAIPNNKGFVKGAGNSGFEYRAYGVKKQLGTIEITPKNIAAEIAKIKSQHLLLTNTENGEILNVKPFVIPIGAEEELHVIPNDTKGDPEPVLGICIQQDYMGEKKSIIFYYAKEHPDPTVKDVDCHNSEVAEFFLKGEEPDPVPPVPPKTEPESFLSTLAKYSFQDQGTTNEDKTLMFKILISSLAVLMAVVVIIFHFALPKQNTTNRMANTSKN